MWIRHRRINWRVFRVEVSGLMKRKALRSHEGKVDELTGLVNDVESVDETVVICD
jgi:hypothetical protein